MAYGVASAPLPNAPMPPPKPGVNGVAGTAPGSGGAKPKSPPGILDVVAGGWLCAIPNGEGAAEGATRASLAETRRSLAPQRRTTLRRSVPRQSVATGQDLLRVIFDFFD